MTIRFAQTFAIGVAALVGAVAPAAFAVTLTNNDDAAHSVEIAVGDKAELVSIEPGQKLENICTAGCDLAGVNNTLTELKGDENVVINAEGRFEVQP